MEQQSWLRCSQEEVYRLCLWGGRTSRSTEVAHSALYKLVLKLHGWTSGLRRQDFDRRRRPSSVRVLTATIGDPDVYSQAPSHSNRSSPNTSSKRLHVIQRICLLTWFTGVSRAHLIAHTHTGSNNAHTLAHARRPSSPACVIVRLLSAACQLSTSQAHWGEVM